MARDNEPGTPGYSKGGTRGSGKASPYRAQRDISSVDWSDVDSTTLSVACGAVVNHGDAFLAGRSMDGGVLVLTICAGTERVKYYARTPAEMTKHLVDIIGALKERTSH